ncbi:hypothetical protein BS50DRAFT_507998 [Corynespora cassiicola Philippines]|uniref:Avirulence Effector AvrLm4-7 domain-containing protein n=1 Tax=Corynespora cassiicola Philippines TaxID=1448308 RepID=A0A2T2N3T1_CORCC|nr:hypothetical protein BS50DRAFT_507998 [Corynespora cassiicola Philippines]
MRGLAFIFTFLLAFYSPIVEACRQRYIEWYKYMPCGGNKGPLDGECWQIEKNMRDYSLSHEKVWGGSFTADNWMQEPGSSYWPKMPNGWERVDPNNGENGWYDTGHKNIDCD